MAPMYKYKREDGSYFEAEQNIKDDPLEECPKTGQSCERVITGGNVLFKFRGAGFHTTDYNDDKPKEDDVIKNKKDPSRDTYNYK